MPDILLYPIVKNRKPLNYSKKWIWLVAFINKLIVLFSSVSLILHQNFYFKKHFLPFIPKILILIFYFTDAGKEIFVNQDSLKNIETLKDIEQEFKKFKNKCQKRMKLKPKKEEEEESSGESD